MSVEAIVLCQSKLVQAMLLSWVPSDAGAKRKLKGEACAVLCSDTLFNARQLIDFNFVERTTREDGYFEVGRIDSHFTPS